MSENQVHLRRDGQHRISVYELVGGQAFFTRLIDAFYEGVESDLELRRIYPEDLEPGKRHLALFLAQYWGGPGEYSAERGHPRLRMRHLPFAIDQRQRDAWVRHMIAAVDATLPSSGLDADVAAAVRSAFVDYFEHAATFMINA